MTNYTFGTDGTDPGLLVENAAGGGTILVSDAATGEPLGVATYGDDGTWKVALPASRIRVSLDGRRWIGPLEPMD
jgi:hypothetical protein